MKPVVSMLLILAAYALVGMLDYQDAVVTESITVAQR